jgi:CBS domain-containing protein
MGQRKTELHGGQSRSLQAVYDADVKVSEVMTAAAVTDASDDTLAEASSKMWQQQTGSLLVMEGSKLIGIVTERDLLKFVGEGGDPKSVSLRDVMTKDVVTVDPDTTVKDAAHIMFDHWFRHLPVVGEDGSVHGVISLRDLLTLVSEARDEPAHLEELTGHKLVRDMRLDRIEAGDLD